MLMKAAMLAAFIAASAPAARAAGNVEAGREKAQLCANCHGAAGISAIAGVPTLAGNLDAFLQWQMVFYRSERRKNPVMGAISALLSDEDVRNLGAYYASLAPDTRPLPPDPKPDLASRGSEVAQEHRCANCHTDEFTGKQGAARLARQREEYVVKSLTEYRSGQRPSTGVAAMTEAAAGLQDDEIAALAHYLAMLP